MSETKSNPSEDEAPKGRRERPKKKEKNVFTYMQSTGEFSWTNANKRFIFVGL
jgi:hypothetical protein